MDATTNKSLSYADVLEESLKVASFLREVGLQRGDVVSLFAENRWEFPLIVFGCFYLGITVNACNPTYTRDELDHVVNLTKPRLIFTSPTSLKGILSVTKHRPFVQDIVSLERTSAPVAKMSFFDDILRKYKPLEGGHFKSEPVNLANTIGLIQMSSGTTGLLKAVLNTQENILTFFSAYL